MAKLPSSRRVADKCPREIALLIVGLLTPSCFAAFPSVTIEVDRWQVLPGANRCPDTPNKNLSGLSAGRVSVVDRLTRAVHRDRWRASDLRVVGVTKA